jgi:SAM-dependent methyltransferase
MKSAQLKRSALPRVLNRFGLLLPLLKGWELTRTLGAERGAGAADGLALPPPVLRMRVAGTTDVSWFLERGRFAEECIRAALARAGVPLGGGEAILDFGCGCGCVLRRWRGLDARVYGTDISSSGIKWCRANLPFAEVGVNALEPPLGYGDASFEVVYALSVFTHLPVEMQLAWSKELCRVVRPGGHLLLTLHGEAFTEGLTPEEQSVWDADGCVVRWATAAGANLCGAFHSPGFVRDRIAASWLLVEHVPRGAGGNPPLDLVVLRKPWT